MIGTAVEAGEVTELVTQPHHLATRFDPDTIPEHDIAGLVTDLGRAGRLVDGMLTRAARRTTAATGHTVTSAVDAATLIATATGTSTATARKVLKASRHLASQPDVDRAVSNGTLSTDQTVLVTETVADAPHTANQLIVAATTHTLPELRKHARTIRQAADPDAEATRTRHLQRRSFGSWTETDGEYNAFLRAPGDLGARIEAAIRAEHDTVFKNAHATGTHEDNACYRLDALINLLESGNSPHTPTDTDQNGASLTDGKQAGADLTDGKETDGQQAQASQTDGQQAASRRRTGRQTTVIIRVDGAALVRDHLQPGDVCEIDGIGRVSLSAVKEQIPDAHITYVISNATDVAVAHLGRQVTARQRTALQARGYHCEIPGCTADHLLEIDHITGWAITHTTRLADLAWLCTHHHRQKTRQGHHLHGPPGQRTWTTQTGITISKDPPPAA